jgi:hypothetical protein
LQERDEVEEKHTKILEALHHHREFPIIRRNQIGWVVVTGRVLDHKTCLYKVVEEEVQL